jgi:hypothetical protein
MRALLLLSFLCVAVDAQTQVTSPVLPAPVNVDRPFAGGVGRYQQWFNVNQFTAITEPMRFEQLEFFAGSGNGASPQPLSVNCEILMGHGKFSSVFGNFDNNWYEPPVMVAPLATQTIQNVPAGQVCMTVPFTNLFTWDQVHPILIEIRVYGNNQGNLPFLFNTQGTTFSIGTTSRVYAGGNANASSGAVSQGVGMITRFQARPGMMLDFGAGCPGEGNIIPQNEALQIAWPGITWTHELTQAASQRTAFWVIGDTNMAPFPVDLTTLFGLPASGCMLLTNPVNAIPVVTVGGGPGGGVAQLPIALPATTNYIGVSLYTQWVVFDPLAQNGVLSVTPGIWTIVAPLGG